MSEQERNLTVRELAKLLSDIPSERQDLPVYATYDGSCITGLYALMTDDENRSYGVDGLLIDGEPAVTIRGD